MTSALLGDRLPRNLTVGGESTLNSIWALALTTVGG